MGTAWESTWESRGEMGIGLGFRGAGPAETQSDSHFPTRFPRRFPRGSHVLRPAERLSGQIEGDRAIRRTPQPPMARGYRTSRPLTPFVYQGIGSLESGPRGGVPRLGNLRTWPAQEP